MQILLKLKISTILGATNGKAVYYIQGDGYMKQLTNPLSEEKSADKTKKQIAATEKLIENTTANW